MKRNHHKNAIKKPPSNNDNIYLSPPPNIYVKKPNMKKNWFKLQVFNRQFVCLEEEKRKIIDTIDYHYFCFFFRILFSKACYISFIIHNDFPLFFVCVNNSPQFVSHIYKKRTFFPKQRKEGIIGFHMIGC